MKKVLQITVILLICLYSYGGVALAASGGRMGGTSFSSSSFGSDHSSISSFGNSVFDDSEFDDTSILRHSSHSSLRASSPTPMEAAAADEVDPNGSSVFIIFLGILLVAFFLILCCSFALDTAKTSVLKLQVGLLNKGGSLQRELNRIAKSADTSTSKGFNRVLQESLLSLLRHADCFISGYSSVDVKWSEEECEKRFNQLSVEERGKFDEESLVNFNSIRKKTATSDHIFYSLLNQQYIVVTIIVCASGVPKLPTIKSRAQLKKALQILGSIPSSNIMGVEVLWTPQKENDFLTEQEMLEDYPLLRPL